MLNDLHSCWHEKDGGGAQDKQGSWDLTVGKEGVTFLIEKIMSSSKNTYQK
jgi:hypothetical protein